MKLVRYIVFNYQETKLLRYGRTMVFLTLDVVLKVFSIPPCAVLEPMLAFSEAHMANIFGPRAPTSEFTLNSMIDENKKATIQFIKELINLKDASS